MSLFAPLDAIFAPAPKPERVAFLLTRPFAHRGLHGQGLIENSRAAFDAALALGRGMECDVQTSADGVPFVFHDYELDRLTGEHGPLATRTAAELDRVALAGAGENLPRLDEILAQVKGRTPILIEIKSPDRNIHSLCLAVAQALRSYRGAVAVMSFNPLVPGWFAAHARQVVRGLVVSEEGKRGLKGKMERTCSLWTAKAEFLAYDVRDLPSSFAARARARGLPVLTWTVRSEAQKQVAAREADQIIYEKQG